MCGDLPDLMGAIPERIASTPMHVIMRFFSFGVASCRCIYRALHAKAMADAKQLRGASELPYDIVALSDWRSAWPASGCLVRLFTGAAPTHQ